MIERATLMLIALVLACISGPSAAETQESRFEKQTSMGYVQFNLLERQKLLEKHAKAQGLGDIKVTWTTFGGPDAMNTALLAGDVDVVIRRRASPDHPLGQDAGNAAGGSRHFGAELAAVPAQHAQCERQDHSRFHRSRPDRRSGDRRVGAGGDAAHGGGPGVRQGKLRQARCADSRTVAVGCDHQPASGGSAFDSVFSVSPFQAQQLQDPANHTVLNSFDVLGGSHSFTVAWTSRKFHDDNPRLYRALMDALAEATDILNADKRAAATLWMEDSKSKRAPELVFRVIGGPQVMWTLAPENTMKYASFMYDVGIVKVVPTTWKELFFPEIHGVSGS